MGALVLRRLGERHGIEVGKRRHQALVGRGEIAGREVVLAFPQTFMNNSGDAVRRLLAFYELTPAHLLVISDDLNLELGDLRLRRGGSDGGQKGLRSIIQHLGTPDFARLRLGIGRLEAGRDATDFVLSPFRRSELDRVEELVDRGADAVQLALRDGLEAAMNRYNARPEPPDLNGRPAPQ